MNLNWLIDLAFPPKCALCGLLDTHAVCAGCQSQFKAAERWNEAHEPDDPLHHIHRMFAYEGRAAQAVQRLKYNRATALAEPLSRWIAEEVETVGLGSVDLFIPVPIHWSRRCIRGFNQAELLCEGLPPEKNRPIYLKRIRSGPPQASLGPVERRRNMTGFFRAMPEVEGKTVLLIDDVFTTGQTARECARALRSVGAREVSVLTLTG